MAGFWVAMLCLGGLFCLGAGLHEVRLRSRLRRIGVRSGGVVIRLDSKAGEDGARLYTPVVAFTDERGERREIRSRVSSTRRPFAVGDQVPVVCLPNRPKTARLDTRGERLSSIGIGIGVGLVFIAAAVFLALR